VEKKRRGFLSQQLWKRKNAWDKGRKVDRLLHDQGKMGKRGGQKVPQPVGTNKKKKLRGFMRHSTKQSALLDAQGEETGIGGKKKRRGKAVTLTSTAYEERCKRGKKKGKRRKKLLAIKKGKKRKKESGQPPVYSDEPWKKRKGQEKAQLVKRGRGHDLTLGMKREGSIDSCYKTRRRKKSPGGFSVRGEKKREATYLGESRQVRRHLTRSIKRRRGETRGGGRFCGDRKRKKKRNAS